MAKIKANQILIATSAHNTEDDTFDCLFLMDRKVIGMIDRAKNFLRDNKEAMEITMTCPKGHVRTLRDSSVLSAEDQDTIRGYDPATILTENEDVKAFNKASEDTIYPCVMRIQVQGKGKNPTFRVVVGVGDEAESMAWCTIVNEGV